MKHGLVLLSDDDTDVPRLPAVCTVSTPGRSWDGGAWRIGAAAAGRGTLWVDRPHFVGKPNASWLVECCRSNDDANGYTQLGNEQNHPVELWPGTADEWLAYQDSVISLHPEGGWIAGPPSPGFPDWQRWVKRNAARHAVHAYGTCAEMRAIVEWFLANTTSELYITECNPGAGTPFDLGAWARDELRPFLDWCAGQPRVRLVAYFAWLWDGSARLPSSVDAATSPALVEVLRTWRPPARPVAQPTPNLPTGGHPMLRGLALWVWYWNDAYLDIARRIGASTLLIKAADGTVAWDQWPTAAAKCREAGIAPIPWAYNYGDAREPAVLAEAATRAGVKRIIIDPEIEYERRNDTDKRAFVEAIRAAKQQHGLTVGCACWARPEVHGAYRFELLAEVVDLWLPMVAWQVWQPRDWAHWLAHWDGFGHRPTAPWLPAYDGVTPEELAESVVHSLERYGAATVWAAHTLDDAQVAALEGVRPAAVAASPGGFDRAAAVDALNGIAHHLARVDQALQDAQRARADVWEKVVELKRAIGVE